MQAIERRDAAAPRIPLDLWVRLNHTDFDADFDADGVDLSLGGLALRSDYLPEVGDRLRCRFDDPEIESSEIQVDGEVVWAHDAGERCGEFGLRFTTLADNAQDGLRRLVEHLGGEAVEGRSIRLHLEGVSSPIEGEILEQDERWLTVEQELPFLELGMGIASESGPRGRLSSVDLRLEGGVPRLVLGVELEPMEAEARDPRDVDTLDEEPETPEEPATYDDDRLEVANDATLHDVSLPEALAEASAEAPVDEGREAQEVRVFAVADEDGADEDGADEALPEAEETPEAPREGVAAKLAPIAAKARASASGAWAKTKPAIAGAWAKLVAVATAIAKQAGPGLKAFFAKLGAFGAVLWGKVKKSRTKRRTTAAVPKRRVAQAPRRRQRAAEEEAAPPPRRRNRRIVALSVLAFIAVGGAVYAFTGGEEATAEEPAETAPAAAPAAAPAPAPAAAPATAAAPAPAAAPASGAEASVEPTGGPLEEPSYPTLRDANPASGGSEGESFGAASVSEGRSATIRMSQPVTTIQGQAIDGGFTVTVPGALALDRAAPIAAANPAVERAMILNRGDHAVLTVRFVAGRTPDYRVVARGRAIEVVIGG